MEARGLHVRRRADRRIRVVVRDRDTIWEPDSGQVRLDFAVADLATRAAAFARRVVDERAATEDLLPDDWYNLAYDLEAPDRDLTLVLEAGGALVLEGLELELQPSGR